jgi:6-phosphogluconolactonase
MIEVYPDADALADAATAAIAAQLAAGVAQRGLASLVGTGGRSPGPVYDRLVSAGLDWAKVTVTLSDERCVAADHPDANARILRQRLLVGAAAAARFLPLWPAPDPADLAALQPFDAVMLGMGEDGHIASLIPGDPGLEDALTTAEPLREVPAGLGEPPLPRITLTLSALIASRALFLLLAGETKRGVIERALAGEDLPVGRLIAQSKAPVRIFWEPGG